MTDLVTIQLDWKTARMVARACIVVAELEDTDGNDARVLELAAATILRSIPTALDEARPIPVTTLESINSKPFGLIDE